MKMTFHDVVEEEATRNYNNAVKTAETRGREEGEKKAKIESAKRFLSMGLSVEQVAAGTGLSLEEVEWLK